MAALLRQFLPSMASRAAKSIASCARLQAVSNLQPSAFKTSMFCRRLGSTTTTTAALCSGLSRIVLSPPHLFTSGCPPRSVGGTSRPPLCSPFSQPARAKHLLVIRRQKMKKHKRRKLAKKFRFARAKVRFERGVLREKKFQAEQLAVISAARAFDARHYVNTVLEKHSTAPLSTKFGYHMLSYNERVRRSPKYLKLEPLPSTADSSSSRAQ